MNAKHTHCRVNLFVTVAAFSTDLVWDGLHIVPLLRKVLNCVGTVKEMARYLTVVVTDLQSIGVDN